MSWRGGAALLLGLTALAVAALGAGAWLYRTLLPPADPPTGGCSFVAVTGGLFLALTAGAIWLLSKRRESSLDTRLRKAVLGESDDEEEKAG